MILITSGHERSLSHEILLKSLSYFSQDEVSKFKLFTDSKILIQKAVELKIATSISGNIISVGNKKLEFIEVAHGKTLSTSTLEAALKVVKPKDVLVTLPSSKDQIYFDLNPCTGYTDYLRKYSNSEVVMSFYSKGLQVLLLTEHIPLSKVGSAISKELILIKLKTYLNGLNAHNIPEVKNVVFAGINPHSGESGLYGLEDKVIEESIVELKKLFSKIAFFGPIPGDSILNTKRNETVFVFSYHDQGLIPFKLLSGLQGVNMSLGLPFLRLSVDHGTGLDLKTGEANPLGLVEVLKLALKK